MEIIQHWQAVETLQPELLADQAFDNCRKTGITSLQSYVTWTDIEPIQDRVDFPAFDPLVAQILKHNLKWVPFLILGPYYATPEWFRESRHSVYSKCLEHNRECRIQSIWNPHLPKYVERFLSLFADHYKDLGILESLLLGVSGNWGESIFPAHGCFIGGSHVHPGWWCGDQHALNDFRRHGIEKYGSLDGVNQAWDTGFDHFEEISFPNVRQSLLLAQYHRIIRQIPSTWKPLLKGLRSRLLEILSDRKPLPHSAGMDNKSLQAIAGKKKYRLDFIQWYQNAMTAWSEYWIKTARKYFPSRPLYLVTGGEGEPMLGADFTAQAKVAARYRAGVRITNQDDTYGSSFIRSRLVASASRSYHTYFSTEEAGYNRPHGVTMRIFDAVTSGARGIYFKGLIGTGTSVCDIPDFPAGEPTEGAAHLTANHGHLTMGTPVIEVAVLYPSTSILLKPLGLQSLYYQCTKLRSAIDFDLVDERMIRDSKLFRYRFLVVLKGGLLQDETIKAIVCWVANGGVLISGRHIKLNALETGDAPDRKLFSDTDSPRKTGGGYTFRPDVRPSRYLSHVIDALLNRTGEFPWRRLMDLTRGRNGLYAGMLKDRIIYYDSRNSRIFSRKHPDV